MSGTVRDMVMKEIPPLDTLQEDWTAIFNAGLSKKRVIPKKYSIITSHISQVGRTFYKSKCL